MARQDRQPRGDLSKNDRPGRCPNHQNAEHESEIADACGNERFLRCIRGRVAFEPVANQNIRGKANQLPKNEQHHEIVRENYAEHREHKERQRREIAGFAFIVPHVAQRINMNQRSDAGNQNEHRLTKIIQYKTKRDSEYSDKVNPVELSRGDTLSGKD